jgi:hypothetical protein
MFKDIAEFGAKGFGALFNMNSYDAALKELYDFLPAPTVRRIIDRLGIPGFVYKKDINILNAPDRLGNPDSVKLGDRVNLFSKGGVADKRMSFSEGGFADAFAEARGNKQELFTWQGNSYTTRRADETDQQYKNFLGKSVDNKVILKEEPYAPADQKEYNNVLAGNSIVEEKTIIPKKKPILKVEKPKKSNFSLFSSAEASIPDDKQEIEVNAQKFLEKDIQPKDTVEANKFGWNNLVNKIPPNVRLMVNDVFKQSTDGKFDKVFTEKNLNTEYQSILKSIALDVLSKGKTNIEYADYKSVEGDNAYADVSYTAKGVPDITDKRFNLKTSLGQATIKVDRNGNLIVVDKFNFNDSADINSFTDFYQMVKEIGGSALQGEGYNLVRKVGKWFGSPEGEGQTVRINLGKIDLAKFKDVKIDRITLAKGDTPSRAWMRDYYFDGKGGFDTFMSFEEFATGPGIDLYLKSKGKKKGGVIRKHFRYGGDTMGGPNDKSNAGQGSGSQGPAGGQSSGGNYGGGNNNNNNNNNNNDGSTARERYIATQYNKNNTKTKTKTKTSNTGGDNGGSSSNNNNNTSNTNKNNKKNTKTFEFGDEGVTRGPFTKYEIDNPITTKSLLNPSDVGAEVAIGYQLSKDVYGFDNQPIDNIYTGKAYLSGTANLEGDTSKSFNIDFSNYKGYDATASYNLDNSILSGNVTKYTDIGDSKYKVGVGVNYNDGDIGPSFQLKKSFKKGGLLDKKRG